MEHSFLLFNNKNWWCLLVYGHEAHDFARFGPLQRKQQCFLGHLLDLYVLSWYLMQISSGQQLTSPLLYHLRVKHWGHAARPIEMTLRDAMIHGRALCVLRNRSHSISRKVSDK